MFAEERQSQIEAYIKNHGAVTTAQLIELLGVSIETIRRDLLQMERQGRLSRVHGGAIAAGDMKPYPALSERVKEFEPQKLALARKAAELVAEKDIIAIDSGSTAVAFAQALRPKFSALTVVTYSLDVFHTLCNHREFAVILCGGHYLQSENACCGPLALEMLRSVHVQKAFLCPSAVSWQYGICDYQSDLIDLQKQLIDSSNEIYVLADSSKFEKKALLKIANMRQDFCYVTDSGLSKELQDRYRENAIKLQIGRN